MKVWEVRLGLGYYEDKYEAVFTVEELKGNFEEGENCYLEQLEADQMRFLCKKISKTFEIEGRRVSIGIDHKPDAQEQNDIKEKMRIALIEDIYRERDDYVRDANNQIHAIISL